MKYGYNFVIIIILLLLLLVSCQDTSKSDVEAIRLQQQEKLVFNEISNNWNFTFPKAFSEVENMLDNWSQWHQFQNELKQKPQTSLSAFRMKVENVSNRSDSLYLSVPERFNNPQVRSRLITLDTQLDRLSLFMQLPTINQEKVIILIQVINEEINSVYKQLDEVVAKERIPVEIGEEVMIRALDTVRLATEKVFEDNLLKTDTIQSEINLKK